MEVTDDSLLVERLGVEIVRRTTVGDEADRIASAVREALDRTTPAHAEAHHATDDPILFLSIYSLDAGQAYVRQVLPAGVAHRVRFITDEEMLAGYPRGGGVFYNPDGPALPPGLVETMRAHDMTPRALLGPADLLFVT